jgi:hypothetical protein
MPLQYVARLTTYLDLKSCEILRSGFDFKLNLPSAIGNLANCNFLASYVSRHKDMAYDRYNDGSGDDSDNGNNGNNGSSCDSDGDVDGDNTGNDEDNGHDDNDTAVAAVRAVGATKTTMVIAKAGGTNNNQLKARRGSGRNGRGGGSGSGGNSDGNSDSN